MKKRTNLEPSVKRKVTNLSLKAGRDIKKLSAEYKVSFYTLSRWRREYRRKEEEKSRLKNKSNFIEVEVKGSGRKNVLKKAELLFANHKCSIEGNLDSGSLMKLVQLLEEEVC